jgi:adenosylcobinamide kinase/adenosylcobinamide-phosphate guanylyltransferase
LNAPERHLILGGARSGKTRHALRLAEALANQQSASVLYVATAHAGDAEMAARIARHRAERPFSWRTLEVPSRLADALLSLPPQSVAIVDCLTLWLSNALLRDFDEQTPYGDLPAWSKERDDLQQALAQCAASLILVSNEVGSGVVPMSALSRRFQDEQGWLNQAVAAVCDRVSLVVAGIAVPLKAPNSFA